MKKALVTGANGFVGTALLHVLSEAGMETIAVVRRPERARTIQGIEGVRVAACEMEDISSLPERIHDRDIDVCIHLAWAGSFGGDRADYGMQLDNVRHSVDLVRAAAGMGIGRFVGAGTLAEKDVLNYHLTDGAEPNAVSMYGAAKVSAHLMTKTQCAAMGMEHVWCRLSNTYGVGNTTNNFVNMASRTMLSGQRASFTAGEQMYDFVYISDTARAIWAAAEKGKKNTEYYLGSTCPRKLKEYIRIIRDEIDPSIELHLGEIPFRGTPLPPEEYDASKLVRDAGYAPGVSFEEGIKWTIDWLKAQR